MTKDFLRIGFDGSRAFVKERTGTENYSYQLLKALAKIDTENHYLVYIRSNSIIPAKVFDPESSDRRAGIYNRSPIRSGMTLEGWPKNFEFKIINFPRFWTQIGLSWQLFKEKLDVLFVPAHTLPIIRPKNLKTVVTVHDLGVEYLPSMHQLKQRLYLKWVTNHQLTSATHIIAVSRATKSDLVKRVGINPRKISVIYEGVDREIFRPLQNDLLVNTLHHYNLQPKTYLLFVGTIQPRKNLERLIKAFSLFMAPGPAGKQPHSTSSPPAGGLRGLNGAPRSPSPLARSLKLVLVGQKGWMSDEIYELPKKLGVEDKVKFLGRVEDNNLVALYNGAIGLIFPSLFEGFGLPILEAFACGCPVLTSNISSMKEIAGDAAILIDPLDIEDISKGIEELLDQKETSSLIKRGLKRQRHFSWEKTAKDTLQLLREVADAKS